jgi:hypothetical protein
MEVHASPLVLASEIYPYSSGDSEIIIYATSKTHVPRMESITTADILADIHPTVVRNLFLDNYFTIRRVPDPGKDFLVERPIFGYAESKLRMVFDQNLGRERLSEKIANQFHVEPFLGYLGLRLRVFLKYEIGDTSYYLMYFGGLYYSTTRPNGAEPDVKVPFPYLLYDYLTVAPRGFKRTTGSSKIEPILVIDDTDYPSGEFTNYEPELAMMGVQIADYFGKSLSEHVLLCITWMPMWYVKTRQAPTAAWEGN